MKKTIGTIFTLLLFVSYALAGPPVGGGSSTGATTTLDTTNFDGQLSGSDTTVQAALETIDEISAGGDEVQVDSGATVNPDFQDGGDINFTNTTNVITATLKDDVVAAAEMADADHGDVAWLGGVAEVQAITASDSGDSGTFYFPIVSSATGTVTVQTDTYAYFNASTNTLTTGILRSRDSNPAFMFLDDDAPGADKDIGNIIAVYVDGGDGAENADVSIRVTKGGSEDTVIAHYDESQDQWELPESLEITGDVIFPEKADHTSTPGAGFGYLWVRNDTPSALIYTDDAGTDHDLTAASTVDTSGTPVANDLARFTDADTIEGLSYAELWAVAGYLSAALAELDDENWTFTGDIDLSGANSVTMGPLTFEDGNATPDAVGEFMYNNTITGLDDGGLQLYDDDEVQTVVALDSSEVLESGDDGHVVTYNWNAGLGNFTLSAAGTGDVTGVGDCASGACLDGTSDGGTYIRIYDGDSNYLELNPGNLSADRAIAFRDAAGTVLISGDTLTGDVTATFDTDGSTATTIQANAVDSSMINTIVDSVAWDAGGMTPDGTQCADAAKVTINSGPAQYTIICADNDASTMYGHIVMPDSWDGGTVTFEGEYLQTAADTSALNSDVTMMCRGAGETVNSTWGTEVALDDAAVTGSNGVDHTTTAAITPNGTCAGGDTLYWRWQLDATGTTTAVATLHFLGAKIEYTSNVGD